MIQGLRTRRPSVIAPCTPGTAASAGSAWIFGIVLSHPPFFTRSSGIEVRRDMDARFSLAGERAPRLQPHAAASLHGHLLPVYVQRGWERVILVSVQEAVLGDLCVMATILQQYCPRSFVDAKYTKSRQYWPSAPRYANLSR